MDADVYTEKLERELDDFRREQERIRRLIGRIGGVRQPQREKAINVIFALLVCTLFFVGVLRDVLHIEWPLPPMLSVEVGIMLVSLKIIWMIHQQTRVAHFQFWILNSIEFRLAEIAKHIESEKG